MQNGCFSFIFTTLLVHTTTLQSPPKIFSSTLINFYLPIPPVLFNKIILTIPTNTPFLYAAGIFHLPIFAYNHPCSLYQKYFQHFNQFRLCQRGYGVLISLFFLKVWIVITGLTITNSLLLMKIPTIGMANHPIHLLLYLQSIVITSIPY